MAAAAVAGHLDERMRAPPSHGGARRALFNEEHCGTQILHGLTRQRRRCGQRTTLYTYGSARAPTSVPCHIITQGPSSARNTPARAVAPHSSPTYLSPQMLSPSLPPQPRPPPTSRSPRQPSPPMTSGGALPMPSDELCPLQRVNASLAAADECGTVIDARR